MPLPFLLTRLLRGVTPEAMGVFYEIIISTHTPLARRDLNKGLCGGSYEISTHTPLARRDNTLYSPFVRFSISTHTPLARRDFLP